LLHMFAKKKVPHVPDLHADRSSMTVGSPENGAFSQIVCPTAPAPSAGTLARATPLPRAAWATDGRQPFFFNRPPPGTRRAVWRVSHTDFFHVHWPTFFLNSNFDFFLADGGGQDGQGLLARHAKVKRTVCGSLSGGSGASGEAQEQNKFSIARSLRTRISRRDPPPGTGSAKPTASCQGVCTE